MKCVLNTITLKSALNKIISVVDKKISRPILACILFEVKDNYLKLEATNLEVSAKLIIPADTISYGKFCVSTKNIYDIIKELPEADVTFELDDNKHLLNITCGVIRYSLLFFKSDEFPHLSFSSPSEGFEIESTQLLDIVNKISHAISLDETRIYLNGVFFHEIDSKLRAVATDGHRLSLIETKFKNPNQSSTLISGIIIPRKGISEIRKLSETYIDKLLNISFDDSFIFIRFEDSCFISIRLIAREYPKYQSVIPNKTSFSVTIDRNLFYDAVRRIKIMANEKSNGVYIKLKKNHMLISANHPSLGEASEEINALYSGKEMDIAFNAKYLVDAISNFNNGDLHIELNNELSPVIFKAPDIPNYLTIIMPLKL